LPGAAGQRACADESISTVCASERRSGCVVLGSEAWWRDVRFGMAWCVRVMVSVGVRGEVGCGRLREGCVGWVWGVVRRLCVGCWRVCAVRSVVVCGSGQVSKYVYVLFACVRR
jgi:hypothetical protein